MSSNSKEFSGNPFAALSGLCATDILCYASILSEDRPVVPLHHPRLFLLQPVQLINQLVDLVFRCWHEWILPLAMQPESAPEWGAPRLHAIARRSSSIDPCAPLMLEYTH